MAATMTETEMRALIQNELTEGITAQLLKTTIQQMADATHSSFSETFTAFEITAGRISVQEREGKKSRDEIERILGDCQTFVSQIQTEQSDARAKLALEVDSSRAQQQSIVTFVESLQPQVSDLKAQIETVNSWFKDTEAGQAAQRVGEVETQVHSALEKVTAFERDMYQLNATIDARFGALTATVSNLQTGTGSFGGFGAGKGGGDRDRNVFDPRDYKIADLGSKPTVVRWKKWRRDLENFVDTIGTTWKGTSGLLRQLRYRDQPFAIGQFDAAVADAEKRNDKIPEKSFYNFEEKADTLYRLIMPKLDELLSSEFAKTGTENGF